MQCPANAPVWLRAAWKEIGVREVGNNRGPDVRRYIKLAHAGSEGDPWCAIFANAMFEACGIPGTRSASSQSFRHHTAFLPIAGPALGAVVVFWRGSRKSGLGHVGFYVGERGGSVYTLGGNEGDRVQIEWMAKAAAAFGLVGYFWPAQLGKPSLGPIELEASVPSHQVSVT
jgi:uncharacterized protein (TIGR02594 family)